jgi:hypothetical protein
MYMADYSEIIVWTTFDKSSYATPTWHLW